GLYGDIRHDESDGRRGTCHETESLAGYGAESFGEGGSRAGGIRQSQVAGLADIEFSGVFRRPLHGDLDGLTYVGYVVAAKDDIVSVTAPALGIPGKVDGEHFRAGGLDRIIYSRDLSRSACTGTQKAQGVIPGSDIHFLKKLRVDAGDHQTDGVQYRGTHKFCSRAVRADASYVHKFLLFYGCPDGRDAPAGS